MTCVGNARKYRVPLPDVRLEAPDARGRDERPEVSPPVHVVSSESELTPIHGGIFVPTMGALHEGHAALIREAARLRRVRFPDAPVVVSVFVNPTQFNDPTDLARYPRTLGSDVEMCRRAGAQAVFAPSIETMYPPGLPVPVPALPPVATEPRLEDGFRPGHFAGVCQVVSRLYELIRPRVALYGQKDWQQLQVLTAMTRSLGLAIQTIGVATVREANGLAMSSRNAFLSVEERARAGSLAAALHEAGRCVLAAEAEERMRAVLAAAGAAVEYAVVRDAETLMTLGPGGAESRPMRALLAARVGSVRLIDNEAWPGGCSA